MITVVGVYDSRQEAERGALELSSVGIQKDNVHILTPGSEQEQSAPTIDGEQPGIVKAIAAVTGGAVGFGIGEGLAALLVPGVGPVLAIGLAGGTLLGALAGGAAGSALENSVFAGLPKDELLVYKDALRRGRTVLIAMATDNKQAREAREALKHTGAESIDRARKMMWLGLRDVEKEHYEPDKDSSQEDAADKSQRRKSASDHT